MTPDAGRSPNCGPRRDGLRPSLIVLHYTAMQSAEAAAARLCDPAAEVSAHYLLARDGTLLTLVDESLRAWHAGAGEWHGQDDINSRSIGIEIDNDGVCGFPEEQMAALEDLLGAIMARWDIPPEGVIGHSDMAPGRKFDPGPLFDWERLEARGLAAPRGTADGPSHVDAAAFRRAARAAGYTADVDDADLLAAVRLRYRAGAKGPLCADDFVPLGHRELWA
ncbi:N-acetylmuramoyl-L-alanine amidase [Sulfitobacter sp. S190]|uniref:N-acetylmuramoyl-L-alanine amidase n=1 Tax=Sulfitobacter sp. S190 TaxID=2867022 RepID=UPI0021A86D0D|nr:N-acetylmuramoyl-L-alanine amidase [Sulfitobacter sp. S190]UWR21551.1 N-acetylmuramoyl-L-alanine amidase [Sulfitobacter sp. S190]